MSLERRHSSPGTTVLGNSWFMAIQQSVLLAFHFSKRQEGMGAALPGCVEKENGAFPATFPSVQSCQAGLLKALYSQLTTLGRTM